MKFFTRKQETDPYWEFDASHHFRPKIKRADLISQTEFDFGWLMLEPLSEMIRKKDHEIERGRRLSYGQKTLYYWWYVDAEVTNGGFVQFYYNGYNQYMPTVITGLEYIGDMEMAALLRKAEEVYQKKQRIIDKAKDEGSFGNSLYDQLGEFAPLDDEYYSLHRQTMMRIESYARQHLNEFCEEVLS